MKVLIIRFSSLGDIVQALAAAQALKEAHPQCEIHWAVRHDFASLLQIVDCVDRVWSLERRSGFAGLWRLAQNLRREKFDLVYDAHSNLRSHFLSMMLRRPGRRFIRRSKERLKRLLLFRFRKNFFPKPYRGAVSYLKPLREFVRTDHVPRLRLKPYTGNKAELARVHERIALAPSAAWELKKWPLDRWQKIIEYLDEQKFVILGGPEDTYLQDIVQVAPERVENWAGRLTWAETAYAVARAPLVVAGDTGILHLGDALGTPTVAILGPTAFGHPSRDNTVVLEKALSCRPCTKDGRGRCYNSQFKKCLNDITPEEVVETAARLLEHSP